jgi:hypothetical protein
MLISGMLTAVGIRREGLPRAARASVFGRLAFDLDRARRPEALVGMRQRILEESAPPRTPAERLGRLKLLGRVERLEALNQRLSYRSLPGLAEEILRGVPEALRDGVFAVRPLIPNLIVNAGEGFLVDAWQNLVELELMRNHGIGTGTVAAAETDTALGTELTTQYNPDNTRATGSLTEGASPNIFRTVGTNTVDAAVAATEWGLFSQAAAPGGTLWSRVVFTVINLASGDSLQTTYDLTVE